MVDRLDIIIFGASGFAGRRCIQEIDQFAKSDGRSLTWGIAGRSKQKLEDVLRELGKVANKNFDSIPINIADINDEESLKRMCASARVILNCCGPYRFFGEPVINACIEAGTHYADISAPIIEPYFVEQIQLKYDKVCGEKGIYVIFACGFDCIPADLGVVFVEKQFEGTLNSVECCLEAYEDENQLPKPIANYGTWQSLVNGVLYRRHLFRNLFSSASPLPPLEPRLKFRGLVRKSEKGNWILPFFGFDHATIMTQKYFYESERKRPVQTQTYFTVFSFLDVIRIGILAIFVALLTQFGYGRSLLLKYPNFFTFGYFNRGGPSEEKQQNTRIIFTLHGKGWPEKFIKSDDKCNKPPDKNIIARVSGTDGYAITCISLVLCGVILITESSKLPEKGGVYSPGAAFAKTSLIDRLDKNVLKFEVLSKN